MFSCFVVVVVVKMQFMAKILALHISFEIVVKVACELFSDLSVFIVNLQVYLNKHSRNGLFSLVSSKYLLTSRSYTNHIRFWAKRHWNSKEWWKYKLFKMTTNEMEMLKDLTIINYYLRIIYIHCAKLYNLHRHTTPTSMILVIQITNDDNDV